MSAQINDGGPAFPVPSVAWKEKGEDCVAIGTRGMTLRDYFAGQALASILVSPKFIETSTKNIVERAYWFADAMLDQRMEEPE